MWLPRLLGRWAGVGEPETGRASKPALLDGEIETIDFHSISGWVIAPDPEGAPVELKLVLNGKVIARTTADIPRPDLTDKGFAPEVRGFCFKRNSIETAIDIRRLSIQLADSGRPLRGSPQEWDRRTAVPQVSLAELSVSTDNSALPYLDRSSLDEAQLDAQQRFWRENGYLVLERFMPDHLTEAYAEARWRLRPTVESWRCPTIHMHVPEARALSCYAPLAKVLEKLIGEPMGIHLNLTGWVSTERNWHQDAYLNPEHLNDHYLAVWFALDDIHPDAGPFEFVPGSHKWPLLSADKVKAQMPAYQRNRIDWPRISEAIVVQAFEREIERQGLEAELFMAKKGDVLIWHSRLLHRGSKPKDPTLLRKSLIAHYSSIHRRPAFPPAEIAPEGGWYFPFDMELDPPISR